MLSFWGAIGAGISGISVYVFSQSESSPALSLPGLILIQGLCFAPFGAFLGLSISYSGKRFTDQKAKTTLWGSIGGFGFGGASVFSILGGAIGLVFLGLCLAAATGLFRVAFAYLAIVVALFVLILTWDAAIKFALPLLYPGAAINLAPAASIIRLITYGYVLNCAALVGHSFGSQKADYAY